MRKGKELKAPHYASTTLTRDYIITCDIIPNNYKLYKYLISFRRFSIKDFKIFAVPKVAIEVATSVIVGNNIMYGHVVVT